MFRRRSVAWLPVTVLLLASTACTELEILGGGNDDEPARIVTLSMTPESSEPAPGEFVDLAIHIANARDVVSTPFKLRVDAAVLRFHSSGSSLGPFLESSEHEAIFIASPDSMDPGVVSVGISLLGAEEGVSGNGDLCYLRFEVLPEATTGATAIVPFDARVFSPGLEEQTVLFSATELMVD